MGARGGEHSINLATSRGWEQTPARRNWRVAARNSEQTGVGGSGGKTQTGKVTHPAALARRRIVHPGGPGSNLREAWPQEPRSDPKLFPLSLAALSPFSLSGADRFELVSEFKPHALLAPPANGRLRIPAPPDSSARQRSTQPFTAVSTPRYCTSAHSCEARDRVSRPVVRDRGPATASPQG